MLYYVQTNHRNTRCPPQCTAAARFEVSLNTTLCCQSNHSGRNVSWMPTATLPPCTTPCHPVCRGRSFWPPCACRISAATTPTWKSGRIPGEHCATVCYSTMGRRGLNFQLFRKGWMLCHNESGQLTGQFPAKAESLLEDTDFHACCREDRLDAAAPTAWCRSWKRWRARTAICLCPVTPAPGPSSRWTALWAGVPTGATAP